MLYVYVLFFWRLFQVVTKSILKKKVFDESWVSCKKFGRVPMEYNVLRKFRHPNIIKVTFTPPFPVSGLCAILAFFFI